jgi:photosystem II stability/assembly factor-like uncharacterized protein
VALVLLATFPTGPANAQAGKISDALDSGSVQALIESKFGIARNSVANLHAVGDSLWVGPFLNLTTDEGRTWQIVESDSLEGTSNRVFSIDVDAGVVAVGLGRNDNAAGDNVQTAAGFLISEDGGESFSYRFPQLDLPGDETVEYGGNTLGALAVIVPQQSPPFDIDYDPIGGNLWVAGWASGVRRSSDLGRTWERVVLPPDNLDFIHPDSTYSFRLEPQRGGSGSLNHMGFAVLVDSDGTIWAGTAGGLNRSLDGGSSWTKFKADGSSRSLTGSWVISIEEQILPSAHVIWMATWNSTDVSGGRFGVTFTDDGGATFQQALQGYRAFDFAFDGETVYVASESGLFVSRNGGRIWTSISQFQDRASPERIVRPGASILSVEVTRSGLWVGTQDGLLHSTDNGETWTIFRVEVPLHPETPTPDVPDVDVFAYPNPFSPAADRFIRIRYELESAGNVEIRVFDFGMNLVRTLSAQQSAGIAELMWDGRDRNGARVANGTYFYDVRAGNQTFRSKILVLE